jgi:hypothetical protein
MKKALLCPLLAAALWMAATWIGRCSEPARDLSALADARKQAQVLHEAMHSTLQLVHHRYYREDEQLPLPAAVLKEIFADVEKETGVSLRWLAVEGQAMNTDHEPQNAFEIEAAKALKSGKKSHEAHEAGSYRRAGAIRLTNECLKCHVPDRRSLEERTAGLIITIPLRSEELPKR